MATAAIFFVIVYNLQPNLFTEFHFFFIKKNGCKIGFNLIPRPPTHPHNPLLRIFNNGNFNQATHFDFRNRSKCDSFNISIFNR